MADRLSSDLASLRIDRSEAPPGRGRGCLVGLAVLAALGAAAWLGWERLAPSLFKTEVAVTEIAMVSPAQASVELTATGYVVPQRQVRCAAKVLQRIAKMNVREGDRVKQGDVLFETEDQEPRAALASARARLLAARARVESARATLAEARRQLERELGLSAEGVVARSVPEDREKQALALEEAANAARQDAAAAEADVHGREIDVANTVVRAPISGVVTAKPLDVGELVGTFTEKPAVELCDFDSMLVEADIPEARVAKVRKDAPCEVVLDAFPTKRFRGVVSELGVRVNRSKATLMVKVRLVDAAEGVLPDMAARVSFLAEGTSAEAAKEPPKLFVPRAALADRAGAAVVFAVDEGRVRMVPVTVAGPFGAGFELRAGPPAGTRVVADPPATLADGQKIKERSTP